METRNITLSLPKDTMVKVKLLAVRRGTSVSGLLAGELERLVAEDDAYSRAKQHHLALLAAADDLGTGGNVSISRDELHERQ